MFNLKEIKSIPCKDVAQKHGIQLKEKHGRWWGKLRSKKQHLSLLIRIIIFGMILVPEKAVLLLI